MVLLIPATIKKLKAEGRKEGRDEERKIWLDWAKQRGLSVNELPPSSSQNTDEGG